MRALLALAALLVFVPAASAAAVEARFEPPTAPVQPLQGPALGRLDVEVACASLTGELAEPLQLRVVESPAWSTVTVSPATLLARREDCAGGVWRGNATVIVSTTGDAPAFAPATLRLIASRTTGENGTAAGLIEAGYFSIVDDTPAVTSMVGEPQSQLVFPVRFANLGNGATTILFTVEKPANWEVVDPPPLSLGSRQAGTPNEATLPITVQTPFRNGYVDEVAAIVVTWRAHHALNASLAGDSGQFVLQAAARGAHLPVPAALAVAALAGAAVVALRRR